jgi:hypothetical protein
LVNPQTRIFASIYFDAFKIAKKLCGKIRWKIRRKNRGGKIANFRLAPAGICAGCGCGAGVLRQAQDEGEEGEGLQVVIVIVGPGRLGWPDGIDHRGINFVITEQQPSLFPMCRQIRAVWHKDITLCFMS